MKHANLSKAEKQYVRSLVHSLSLQRFTDQEVVDYLRHEKRIDIARTTVNNIRNHLEKDAEKWYIQLRDSSAKYIAIYKERMDSLLSYQKKLNQIVSSRSDNYPEIAIRAITELHRIELSLHTLMKELPGDIKTARDVEDDQEKNHNTTGFMKFDEWRHDKQIPRVMNDSDYTDEENGKYYWDLHNRYNQYVEGWKNQKFGPDPIPKPEPWTMP